MGIKGQNRHYTHYCSSMVFVEWVEMAAPGWVCSRATLWVAIDAFCGAINELRC